MAYALELAFDIPPAWGYLVCALVVIPLVTHGVTAISRLQVWTQPMWLVMLVVPFVYVLLREPGAFVGIAQYDGASECRGPSSTAPVRRGDDRRHRADHADGRAGRLPALHAGDALAPTAGRWWPGVLVGGPGWVMPGVPRCWAARCWRTWRISAHGAGRARGRPEPDVPGGLRVRVLPTSAWAVAATALFVVISQLKINVTNAYAGSLAWSNFFSRLTHSHPGRVVWVVFNTLIALMLMELDVFQALGKVLGLYSNIAIAWMMAVVADLVINKPLGCRPQGIEFKRAHLYDINPVGVGAMALASLLSITAHLGVFGPLAQAFSALIALVTAFVAAPLIAWATKGRYYLARSAAVACARASSAAPLRHLRARIRRRRHGALPGLPGPDLLAVLHARCALRRPVQAAGAPVGAVVGGAARRAAAARLALPRHRARPLPAADGGHRAAAGGAVRRALPAGAARAGRRWSAGRSRPRCARASSRPTSLLLLAGIVAWWLVLAHKSRQVAQEESNRQTHLLMREIELHRETDAPLQAGQAQADAANQAKSRYISAISHELRTPLNSILGYAQLLDEDDSVPPHRRQAVAVIRRGGEHLLTLIEGTLDIARIEAGKLTLEPSRCAFATCMQETGRMFELQAAGKGMAFRFELGGALPEVVRADEKRLRQILINVLGNAVKFTARGQVALRVRYAREIAAFEIEDTGPGMSPKRSSACSSRSRAAQRPATRRGGTGLGLTIAKMLTDLMGGEMTVQSTPGQGTLFRIRLFLPRCTRPRRMRPLRSCRPRRGAATQARGGACWWSTTRRSTASCW